VEVFYPTSTRDNFSTMLSSVLLKTFIIGAACLFTYLFMIIHKMAGCCEHYNNSSPFIKAGNVFMSSDIT
jgi:hypothetical protein